MTGLVFWFNFSNKCIAIWATMGVFSESWETIDQTTCNPRATETTENSPGPATTRDGGVNSRRNLISAVLAQNFSRF